jgi:hypothetical protein
MEDGTEFQLQALPCSCCDSKEVGIENLELVLHYAFFVDYRKEVCSHLVCFDFPSEEIYQDNSMEGGTEVQLLALLCSCCDSKEVGI